MDFERSRTDETPSNVTGFCQFVTSSNYGKILKDKGFTIDKDKIILKAREYKRSYSDDSYKEILKLII
ncbi:hypothetical protein BVX95_02185 [archaeon D22]|nr:hypothetical protein BVX95_02185 [archaeon D22]